MAKSIFSNANELLMGERITLERGRKELAFAIGSTAADSLRISVQDDIQGVMGKIVGASFDVLRDKIHEDKATTYYSWKIPSSWWQHFKQDKMPRWFTNRYPVQYTTHRAKRTATFKRYAEYPKANIHLPKDSRVFIETLGGLEVINDVVQTHSF